MVLVKDLCRGGSVSEHLRGYRSGFLSVRLPVRRMKSLSGHKSPSFGRKHSIASSNRGGCSRSFSRKT